MKSKEKNGISLIVLVITIVIMIILASAIILSMNDNNQAENAREADVKSDVASLMEEFNNYNSNLLFENATSVDTYNKNQINIDLNGNVIYDGTEKDNISIKDIIPSIDDSRYKDKVFIAYGEIYIDNRNNSLSEKEKTWIKEAGINILDSGVILVINTNSLRLNIGESQTLKVMALPDFNEDVQLSWSSEASNIASVVEGVVTAKTEGVTKITASTDTSSASCTVKVGDFPVYDIASIKLDINDLTLSVGQSKKLNATITPNEASISNLVWKSSNSNIVTVDSNGLVIGVSPGSTVITVSNEDGTVSDTCNVKVSSPWMPVTSVELNKNSMTLTKDSSETLVATVLPSNATNKEVSWSSTNSNIATVDNNGLVIAKAIGTTTITVTSQADPTKKATCTVNVVESLELEASIAAITSSTVSVKINAIANTGNITNIKVQRRKNGDATTTTSTINVNNTTYNSTYNISGLTSNSTYQVTVIATCSDGSTKQVVLSATTTEIKVTSVSLNKNSITLVKGESEKLIATVLPSNATNKAVSWSSSNSSIAAVDSSGVVTAVDVGSSTITVTSQADITKKVTCTVNVVDAVVELNGHYYETLQDAFDDLWTIPGEDEDYLGDQVINVLKDFEVTGTSIMEENTYASLNLNGKTITNNGNSEVIICNGDLKIIGEGTIDGKNSSTSTIKNTGNLTILNNLTVKGGENTIENTSMLYIYSGTIEDSYNDTIINSGTVNLKDGKISCGNLSAFAINGGNVNISGGSVYCDSSAILLNSGTSYITGGNIYAYEDEAINITNGATLTLGVNDGGVPSTTSPSIISDLSEGIVNKGVLNFYDGVIKGITAISGTVSNIPSGYEVSKVTSNGLQVATLSSTQNPIVSVDIIKTQVGLNNNISVYYETTLNQNVSYDEYYSELYYRELGDTEWTVITNSDSSTTSNLSITKDIKANTTYEMLVKGIVIKGTNTYSKDSDTVQITTNEGETVNTPNITNGMIPVKYNLDNNMWEITNKFDTEWYSYISSGNSKWANVMLSDGVYKADGVSLGESGKNATDGTLVATSELGSMFVWIPRFAYKISSTTYSDNLGSMEIKFIDNTNCTLDTSNIDMSEQEGWKIERAFVNDPQNGGWDSELDGIWVAKYRGYEDDSGVRFLPLERAILEQFDNAVSYINLMQKENNIYGLLTDKTKVDIHLTKNTEWGAVAYLAQSPYGNIIKESSGFNSSYTTTGNVYGIYDLCDQSNYELVAAFCSLEVIEEGWEESGDGYTDVVVLGQWKYEVNTDIVQAKYRYYKEVFMQGPIGDGALSPYFILSTDGDAMEETSGWGNGSAKRMFYDDTNLFVVRGKENIFGYSCDGEYSNNIVYGPTYTYRSVLNVM